MANEWHGWLLNKKKKAHLNFYLSQISMYRQNVIKKNNIFPLQSLHKLFGFPIFLHLAYMMKVILETCHAH